MANARAIGNIIGAGATIVISVAANGQFSAFVSPYTIWSDAVSILTTIQAAGVVLNLTSNIDGSITSSIITIPTPGDASYVPVIGLAAGSISNIMLDPINDL